MPFATKAIAREHVGGHLTACVSFKDLTFALQTLLADLALGLLDVQVLEPECIEAAAISFSDSKGKLTLLPGFTQHRTVL